MRVTRKAWDEWAKKMPGRVIGGWNPSCPRVLYSVARSGAEAFTLYAGHITFGDRKPELRVSTVVEGPALPVCLALDEAGFSLPLPEPDNKALKLPDPLALYTQLAHRRMPGLPLRHQDEEQGPFRYSLAPARRSGWKLFFIRIPSESELFSGSYLRAIRNGEFPVAAWANRIGGTWIASRHGVIRDSELDEVLELISVPAASVFELAPRISSKKG